MELNKEIHICILKRMWVTLKTMRTFCLFALVFFKLMCSPLCVKVVLILVTRVIGGSWHLALAATGMLVCSLLTPEAHGAVAHTRDTHSYAHGTSPLVTTIIRQTDLTVWFSHWRRALYEVQVGLVGPTRWVRWVPQGGSGAYL